MSQLFAVPATVRGHETDAQGHLSQSVYLNYVEHTRWSLFQAAGIRQADSWPGAWAPSPWRRPSASGGSCSPGTRWR
ncbi:hypothetical protein GCM10022384_36760 [Streptomyces marokkonensis]|uniref:Thioesterase n=1 Tax=Streptomyces marokkonensis TaxID=324855 RepID=A0ABP7QNE8_9ACTN